MARTQHRQRNTRIMKIFDSRDRFGSRCTRTARALERRCGHKDKGPVRLHGPGARGVTGLNVGAGGEPGREMPGGQAGTIVRCQARLPDNDGMIRDITISAKRHRRRPVLRASRPGPEPDRHRR